MYKNLAFKLVTGKLKEPQPRGAHFKRQINAEGAIQPSILSV